MRGADFLQLDPSRAPARGATEWLVAELRTAIADGRLGAGARLPATRLLADELGVARGCVVEAYQRLREEGLVEGRTRAGTVVRAAPGREVPSRRATPPPAGLPPAPPDSGISYDLNPGLPDLSAFPRAAWSRHERAVFAEQSSHDLGYGDPRGHPELRGALAGWLGRTRGVRAAPDDILIVAGVAQSLALLARVLTASGRGSIAVEDPGSRGALDQLAHWGVRGVPVPVDDEGMRVSVLALTAADAALVTPAHQFPTGVVMSAPRRVALLDWASGGRLVIEDDYDADQRYDRAPVAAMQPTAPELVVHTGSTSKSLAPGLRLGWLVPPRSLYDALVDARRHTDLGSPALPQLILARLLASGDYDRHLRRQRVHHRARRDALLAALRDLLPQAEVGGIAAGLHVQVVLPWLDGVVDDVVLVARLAARGVRAQPLGWHRHAPGPPGLVLGYAATSPSRLREAVQHIAAATATAAQR